LNLFCLQNVKASLALIRVLSKLIIGRLAVFNVEDELGD